MENSIYLALSRQVVLRNNLDIVSNNIANMTTSGFRGQNTLFQEYLSDPRYNDNPMSFVRDYGEYQMTDPGPMQQTGNDLNVALVGDGFMGIKAADGSTAYTRDGNFSQTADGTLVNASGLPVMGQGGGPVQIPAGSTEIVIDEKGVISNQNGQIGQLMVVEFPNVQTLEPFGGNLYKDPQNSGKPAEKTTVSQGFLEGSNIRPVVEMNRMVQILRDYQNNQKILETEHDRLRSTIQKLTQS